MRLFWYRRILVLLVLIAMIYGAYLGKEYIKKENKESQVNSTYIENNSDLPAMSEKERAVLAQLTGQPQETAELIAKLDMSSSEVLSALTLLTIKGLAKKHPGGSYSLK